MSNTFSFLFYICDYKQVCYWTYVITMSCRLYVNCLLQREEKEDYTAEAQFVSEHGHMLARKVSQSCFHHLH